VPFVIQDYPLTFSVQMTPGVIRRIHMECPSCWFLKHEDWPGLDKVSQLRAWEKDGSLRRLPILVGNNGLFLDFELERGVDGANTGYCFPDMLVDVVRLSKAGKRDEAHDLFDAHLPLIRYEQQPGPGMAVRKYVMMKRGIIAHDTLRKPGAALSPTAKAEVDYLMARVARVDPRARV
jgi:4-hydroxy-tetrahydrodipicolinate synthase